MGCLANVDVDGGLIRGRQREKKRDRYSAVDKAITCLIPLGAPLSITWLYIIDFHISLSQSSWFWNYLPFNRSSIWHECPALVPCLSSPPFLLPPSSPCVVCLFSLTRFVGRSRRRLINQAAPNRLLLPFPKIFAELNSNNANTSTLRSSSPPSLAIVCAKTASTS